jgi:hypothetical protein
MLGVIFVSLILRSGSAFILVLYLDLRVTSNKKLISYRNAIANDIKKCSAQFASSEYSLLLESKIQLGNVLNSTHNVLSHDNFNIHTCNMLDKLDGSSLISVL